MKKQTKETKQNNEQLKLEVEESLELITIKSRKSNKALDFDLSKLNKTNKTKLKTLINTHHRKGDLRVSTETKTLVYPKRGGGFTQVSIKEFENSLYLTKFNKGQLNMSNLDYIYAFMLSALPKVNSKQLEEVEFWVKYAKSVGIKVPSSWDIVKPRWIKTMKVIYISSYLDNYYTSNEKLPNVRAIRSIVNNLTPQRANILITDSKPTVKKEAVTVVKDRKLKQEAIVLYQEDSKMVPGYKDYNIVNGGKKVLTSGIETKVGEDPTVVLVNNKNKSSKIIFYTGSNLNYITSDNRDSMNIKKERLMELSQRLSISMQYPLSYVEWK